MQEWQSELMTSCDSYVEKWQSDLHFKQELKLEKYLLHGNKKYGHAIGNFRMNNTRIPKVIKRYKGLDGNQRISFTFALTIIWEMSIIFCLNVRLQL